MMKMYTKEELAERVKRISKTQPFEMSLKVSNNNTSWKAPLKCDKAPCTNCSKEQNDACLADYEKWEAQHNLETQDQMS